MRTQCYEVVEVTDDGDGDATVTLDNGAWLTWHPSDTACRPRVGDRVRCALPQIVEVLRDAAVPEGVA